MSQRPTTAYKVLTTPEMETLEHQRVFGGAPVDLADGFIHLSTADQLTGTVDKHFVGQTGLYIAAVDLAALGPSLKWEESRGGQLFPHLYGPLLLETVVAYSPMERNDDGTVRLPVTG